MTAPATEAVRLTPDRYHVIGPDQFGAPGLWARESVGPSAPVQAVGTVVTIHDSRFDPGCGIGHHPHRGMERLFYILEGEVHHDDTLNGITGRMGTGDLGILTEGRKGMLHSEWNRGDTPARAYILVVATDPPPPTASFDAIRDPEAPRRRLGPGAESKRVVERGAGRLHGDVRELADTRLDDGAALDVAVGPDEPVVVFVVAGEVEVGGLATGAGAPVPAAPLPVRAGRDHTVVVPPVPDAHVVRVTGKAPSRVVHAVAGPGAGLRRAR